MAKANRTSLPTGQEKLEIAEVGSALSSRSIVTPAEAYLMSLPSPISKRGMKSALNRVAKTIRPSLEGAGAWREIPWEKLTAPAVRKIFADLDGAPASRNVALSAIKGVARMAWEMRRISTDELERIKAIRGDRGKRELAGRYMLRKELLRLLKVCAGDPSPAGVRDAFLLSVAVACGLRRAELANLHLSQFGPKESGSVCFKVVGKGNKERTLFASGAVLTSLEQWRMERGEELGPIICQIRKGGRIEPLLPLSTTALAKVLSKRCRQAGVENLTWHDFRRTAASDLLDAGVDLVTVAKVMGHSSTTTTARYDRRDERAILHASSAVSIPFVPREA